MWFLVTIKTYLSFFALSSWDVIEPINIGHDKGRIFEKT